LKSYSFTTVHAEEQESDPTPVFEKQRRQAKSKEDNRDIISSQHLQVKKSWENPGVYAWGSNSGRVVAPDSDEKFIKTARRIPFFDGVLLRDIKLDRTFGAAIDERGDLLQWGTGYKPDFEAPEKTLKGKNLRSLTISRDRILALSDAGDVYSLPVSQDEQQSGPKVSEA
jgi:alpha-tubulin suppressor-like RCC1 family protein